MEALWLLGVFLGGVAVGIAIAVDNKRLSDLFDDYQPPPLRLNVPAGTETGRPFPDSIMLDGTDLIRTATKEPVGAGGNATFPTDP